MTALLLSLSHYTPKPLSFFHIPGFLAAKASSSLSLISRMAVTGNTEADRKIEEFMSKPENKFCFDCGKEDPTMAAIAFGVCICNDCADIHANFKGSINNVRPIYFPDWPTTKLVRMILGGNRFARKFFEQHGWTAGGDLEAKYTSEVAKLYRKKLSEKAFSVDYPNKPERKLGSARSSVSDTREFMAWSGANDSKSMCATSSLLDTIVTRILKIATREYGVPKTSPAISNPDISGCGRHEPPPTCSVHDMVDQVSIQETYEARRRFPNAKSISSAQFFGNHDKMDDTGAKLCLQKFVDAIFISSADIFGSKSKEPLKVALLDSLDS